MHYVKNKIRICGSKKDVMTAADIIGKCPGLQISKEPEARRCIQILIDTYALKATILWDGNTVWSKKWILRDMKKVLKNGMIVLSDYLYAFFHLCCGSIAHYDKHGWICEYPDIKAIKDFLLKNEYGQSALKHQPSWASDRIEILKEIYKMFGLKEIP